MSSKRALVIGIDKYPRLSARRQLDGCVNDARLMADVLRDKFAIEELTLVTDEEARREDILRELDALVERTGPDDLAIVYYAGHGSRVADRDGDEVDGRDSTIMPHDSGRSPHPNLDITDDEIHVRLLKLAAKPATVALIFDCCHSGTISRDASLAKTRGSEEDSRPPSVPASISEADRELLADARRSPSGWLSPGTRYTLISGCRDVEESHEHVARGADGTRVAHGALTYFLTDALRKAVPGTTYRDVFESVSSKVTGVYRNQHPQVEGALDRELFGTRDIEPLQSFRITERSEDLVTLSGGAAHGIGVRSIWAVHPEGAREAPADRRLGLVEVETTGGTTSVARVVEERPEAGTIGPGCRAVLDDPGQPRLGVRMEGDPSHAPEAWKAVREGIVMKAMLELAQDEGPLVRVALVPGRAEIREDTPFPEAGRLEGPTWLVVSETGLPLMAPKRAEEVDDVVHNLGLWASYRHNLAADQPGGDLARDVRLVVTVRSPDGAWVDVRSGGELPRAHVGEPVDIGIENVGQDPLWVKVYHFQATGAVDALGFPDNPLPPGSRYFLFGGSEGPGGPGVVTWTPPPSFGPEPGSALETLKAMITREQTDFSAFEQGGVRAFEGTPAPAPDWGTTLFPLEIHRQPRPAERWAGMTPLASPTSLAAPPQETAGTSAPAAPTGTVQAAPAPAPAAPTVLSGTDRPPAPPSLSGHVEGAVDASVPDRLTQLISDGGFRSVGDVQPPVRSRSADGPDEGPDPLPTEGPPEGHAELLLSQDEAGVVRFHLPVEVLPGARTRGAEDDEVLAPSPRTYRIEADRPATRAAPEGDEEAGGSGTRGVLGMAATRVLQRVVFPLIDPAIEVAGGQLVRRWEQWRHPDALRLFGPSVPRESNGSGDLSREAWEHLASGPVLLLVHGLFSSTDKTFAEFAPWMAALAVRYEGRVLAFDHRTVGADPAENATTLLDRVPPDLALEFDVLAHSRGGLVARLIADRAAERARDGARVHVRRVVQVGTPNLGTRLASASSMEALLSTFTNLIAIVDPTEVAGPVLAVAKQVASGVWKGLDGIQALDPEGTFLTELAGRAPAGPTLYFGMASEVSSGSEAPLISSMITKLSAPTFGDEPNDLVVTSASALGQEGSPPLPFAEISRLEGASGVTHLEYFRNDGVREQVVDWLLREERPVEVTIPTEPDGVSAERADDRTPPSRTDPARGTQGETPRQTGDGSLVEGLEADLRRSLATVASNVRRAAEMTGPERPHLSGLLHAAAEAELGRARFLADRIVALRGPAAGPESDPPAAAEARAGIQEALASAREQAEALARRVTHAESEGRVGLAAGLVRALDEVSRYADELELILRGWRG